MGLFSKKKYYNFPDNWADGIREDLEAGDEVVYDPTVPYPSKGKAKGKGKHKYRDVDAKYVAARKLCDQINSGERPLRSHQHTPSPYGVYVEVDDNGVTHILQDVNGKIVPRRYYGKEKKRQSLENGPPDMNDDYILPKRHGRNKSPAGPNGLPFYIRPQLGCDLYSVGGQGNNHDRFAPPQFGVPSMPRSGPSMGSGVSRRDWADIASNQPASQQFGPRGPGNGQQIPILPFPPSSPSSMQAQPASTRLPPRPGKIREGERLPTGIVDPIATHSSHEYGHHGLREHLPGMTHLNVEDLGRADDLRGEWKLLEDIQRLGLGNGSGGGGGRRNEKRPGGGPESRRWPGYTHGPR